MTNLFIAGHKGLVGSALVRAVETGGQHSWTGAGREELDLLNRDQVFEYIHSSRPDAIVIAAARVGGILANSSFPVEFLSENLRIMTNLLDASHSANIDRVLFLGSSCIYPRMSPQPIREEYLLTGELEPTNEAYALAKISGLKMIQAYRKEYGRDWISIMPTNLYGPNDNFDIESSHVLPAMLRRFDEAKENSVPSVEVWGSGSPRREFLHVDDLAQACLFVLENYSGDIPLNVGTGVDVSIKELAELTRDIVGYGGEIKWDTSRPDGTPRKLLDVSRIEKLGWRHKIQLSDGLKNTYEWYKSSQEV